MSEARIMRRANLLALGAALLIGSLATAAQGAWEYSADGGTTWTAIPSVLSNADSLLLPANAPMPTTAAIDRRISRTINIPPTPSR